MAAPSTPTPDGADDDIGSSHDQRLLQFATWNKMLVRLAKSKALDNADLGAALREITEAAAHAMGVPRASVWLYTPNRDAIRCLDLYETSEAKHSSGVVLKRADFPAYFRALEEERTIPADDAHTDPRTAEFSAPYLTPLGIGAMLDAPIREHGEMTGVICHEFVGPRRHWTLDEQQLAGTLADFVSLSMEAAERRRAERELEARANELARSNAELEQFAYVASHDLQEPLRMVASYVGLLAKKYKGRLDEDADKYIAYAQDGAQRMQRLISDLLEYSRAGKFEEASKPVALTHVLSVVTANLRTRIEETGARIDATELPTVRGDETALTQLLQNLVDNGLKYRRPDVAPVIRVSGTRAGADWTISVADNGIGVEPQFRERIFRIFQRLHARGEYDGSGIGLSIAKRIVERHGGRIWVETPAGGGTAFVFTLPARG